MRSASRGGNLCLFAPPSPILHCTTHGGARSEGECRSGREIRRAYHPEIKQEHKKVSGEAVSPAVGSAARRSSDMSESGEPSREGLAARGTSKKEKKNARCLKCDRKPLRRVCKGFPFRRPAWHAFAHRGKKSVCALLPMRPRHFTFLADNRRKLSLPGEKNQAVPHGLCI